MIKAVLFDMDGTVLDTEPMYKRAWKAAFDSAGYEFSEELFNKCVGLSVVLVKKLVNETYNNPDLFSITFPKAAALPTHKTTPCILEYAVKTVLKTGAILLSPKKI